MLGNFGAVIRRREIDDEGHRAQEIVLSGQPELVGRAVQVPADPSSAAFPLVAALLLPGSERSEEHTSELQSLMSISYAVFCLKKKKLLIHNTMSTNTNIVA